MYKCNHCDYIFIEPEEKHERESRGEFWGMPAYEDVYYELCPRCGSDDIDPYSDEDEDDLEDEEI